MGSQKELKDEKRSGIKGNKDKRLKVPFSEFRFVRIELTEAERSAFKSLLDSGEFAELPIDTWVDAGYKISLTRDGKTSGVVASLTAVYTDHYNAGLILTGRGRDTATALAVLCYKDTYLADEDGWAAAENRRGGGYDDVG